MVVKKSSFTLIACRNISLVKWAVLIGFFIPLGSIAANLTSSNSIKETSQAYGFVVGQEYSITRVIRDYPDMAAKGDLARLQFDATFPNIKSKLEAQMIETLGAKGFGDFKLSIELKLKETLSKHRINKEGAANFFELVHDRSKGEIESPILENLLAVNYMDYPYGEFADGYRQRFQTDGSGKSQGIKLKLQLPRSWIAKEGERPHIVQKWLSRSNNSMQMIHLDIRDAKGYMPTKNEMAEFVTSGEVRDIIPEGATYIDSGNFTLEKQNGYWLQMAISQERAGAEYYQVSIMYQLFFRGKGIGIMCAVAGKDNDRVKIGEAFNQIKPMCQQVVNSLVLLQTY